MSDIHLEHSQAGVIGDNAHIEGGIHFHATVPPTPGTPFMAGDLPPDFVPRPHEFEALRDTLLAEDRDAPVAITAALRGAGGYGKTTMATALCHNEHVRAAFPDGVLWVTLGETPDVTSSAIKLYDALTGKRPTFVDVEDAAQKLAAALGDKRCLIVVDDVWNRVHLRPFLRGGPNCARLITTRNRDTLPADVHPVDVDAMRVKEAVALVEAGLPLETQDFASLRKLVARLGEWPLLLKLVNGALRARTERGQSLDDALTWVDHALDKRGMTAFDARDAAARDQAVERTIDVSLNLLNEEERARYNELAVFPKDVDIPLTALEVLWDATGGLDDFDVEELCQRLANLSLVQNFDLSKRVLRLHDVVHNYLENQQADLPALHAQFADAYAELCEGKKWATGLDDNYFFLYLPYHLAQAERTIDLHTLLLDFDWLHTKLYATDINALITDYDLSSTPRGGNEEENALHLIQGALRLSAHVLAYDPAQLPGQILGRLMSVQNNEIHSLIEKIKTHSEKTPWLRPLKPSLISPISPLLRTLRGHRYPIQAVAITKDGRWVISGSRASIGWGGTIKVWDLATGKEQELQGHHEGIEGITVTPDGQRVISASADYTLKVWNLMTGEEEQTLNGHRMEINAVVVTSDGESVISVSDDRKLKVWDLATGTEILTLRGHMDWIRTVAVTPDGQWAVSGDEGGVLKVWNLVKGKEVRTLNGHTDKIEAVAITSDGQCVISGDRSGIIKIWDLATGKEKYVLPGHAKSVNALALLPNEQRIISGSQDRTLKIWNITTGTEEITLHGHTKGINAVAVTLDGQRMVSGSFDGTLKIWNLSMKVKAWVPHGHKAKVTGIVTTLNGRRAISFSNDKTLKMWGLETGREIFTLPGHMEQICAVTVTPDGRWAVSGDKNGVLKVWNLVMGKETQTLNGHKDRINSVAVTSDGQQIVSVSDDYTLKVWRLDTGEEQNLPQEEATKVKAVTALSEEQRVVSVSLNGTLKVWNTITGSNLCTIPGQEKWIDKMFITPSERWAISWGGGFSEGKIIVYDLEMKRKKLSLSGHTSSINSVAMTPDGHYMISAGSWDNLLKVWNLEKETVTEIGIQANDVAVTPDGRRAISVSDDWTLRVWDLERKEIITTFSADGEIDVCAVASDGTIIAGGTSGRMHFLELMEPEQSETE